MSNSVIKVGLQDKISLMSIKVEGYIIFDHEI